MNAKRLSPIAIALLGLATAQADSKADTPSSEAPKAAESESHHGAPDSLHDAMEVMGKSLKGLRKLEAGDFAGGVALVKQAREAAYIAIQFLPHVVEEIPDARIKAMETTNYKRLAGQAYVDLCELELAYHAQDEAAIDAAKKKVFATKKEGHDKYEDEH